MHVARVQMWSFDINRSSYPPGRGASLGGNDSKTRHPEAGTNARNVQPSLSNSLATAVAVVQQCVGTHLPFKANLLELSNMLILGATLVSKLTTLVSKLPPGVLLTRQKVAVSSRDRWCLSAVSL